MAASMNLPTKCNTSLVHPCDVSPHTCPMTKSFQPKRPLRLLQPVINPLRITPDRFYTTNSPATAARAGLPQSCSTSVRANCKAAPEP